MRALFLVAVFFAALGAAPAARAQSLELQQSRGVWWAVTGIESSLVVSSGLVGLLAYGLQDGGAGSGSVGSGLLLGSLVGGIAMGFAADSGRWDPRIAFAIHGGLWLGATGVFVGSLLDGLGDPDDVFGFGPWTVALGLAGIAAGATFGALGIDSDLGALSYYLAPVVGALTALLAYGIVSMLSTDGLDETQSSRRDWTAVSIGWGTTFAAAILIAAIADPSEP